ncbi:MAG: SulP family inorganic anion transporter [Candidatus Gracilibacteria bacterium]|nr:SulP family inorganic anion transporter [Candidatus Gracilibacteria bacterium]
MLLLKWLSDNDYIDLEKKGQVKADVLSGITVALALIPEAIAFSFVAGVDPMVGLWAAFIMGLMTAIFGGRPGMISGATGAMAVVMTPLVIDFGLDYLLVAVIFAGIIQVLFGLFKLGKIVRLIPHSVMLGFVNGLAIIIFLAQMGQFQNSSGDWLNATPMIIMLVLVLLTMAIIHFLPKFTKIIPSGLAGIVIVTLMVIFIPELSNTGTVQTYLANNSADGIGMLKGGFPTFSIPNITDNFLEVLKIILPYSLILAIIGLTESLMTLTLIDEITETRGKSNREAVGQGVSNMTCGFFGAMGGCAMIGQSMININNGGRKRLSGVSASIFLILFVVFGTSLILKIPLAALVGLMFMVVIGTFAWPTLKMLNKIPKSDAFVVISVTLITAFSHNLALAVVSGVVISALVFAWQKSQEIIAKKVISKDGKITTYTIDGALFFASVTKFKEIFNPKNDSKEVVIDFANSRVMDHSAIEAINNITEKYRKQGKKLHLIHLSPDCRKLIKNADKIVEINISEDPKYFVSDDKLG